MSADKYQMGSVLVIQGPNLNLLGTREPEIYGFETLDDIHRQLHLQASAASVHLETFQSNHEGEVIDRIHLAKKEGYGNNRKD